jgi:hypothetical protein
MMHCDVWWYNNNMKELKTMKESKAQEDWKFAKSEAARIFEDVEKNTEVSKDSAAATFAMTCSTNLLLIGIGNLLHELSSEIRNYKYTRNMMG